MSDTFHKTSVRSELREAQVNAQELRDYRNRILNSKGMDPKVMLDLEAEARKAVEQVAQRVRTLEERIAWSIHRSQS